MILLMFAISLIGLIIALLVITKDDKLARRFEEAEKIWNMYRKQDPETVFESRDFCVTKEGNCLAIDISTSKSHKRFFIPNITKSDIEGLIEALKKVDSVS